MEHEHGIDWRLNMTDELFIQINNELGPPTSMDEEFRRYQIAREAANKFWDWVAIRGSRAGDWREQDDVKLGEVRTAALLRARDLNT